MKNTNRVLVTAATGKCGFQSCQALVQKGFEVFDTIRSKEGGDMLKIIDVTPIIKNYVTNFSECLEESDASKLYFMTDFWTAARKNTDKEVEQGKMMIDIAAAATNVDHVIFASIADVEKYLKECSHVHTKVKVEACLKASSIKCWSIVRASCFFENFDDTANYNPLTKGSLKFLMTESLKCAQHTI